jgi:hypothetical protein
MREQGSCLVNAKEPAYIRIFDRMPAEVRAIVRESRYDLCAACFKDRLDDHSWYQMSPTELNRLARQIVSGMERQIDWMLAEQDAEWMVA